MNCMINFLQWLYFVANFEFCSVFHVLSPLLWSLHNKTPGITQPRILLKHWTLGRIVQKCFSENSLGIHHSGSATEFLIVLFIRSIFLATYRIASLASFLDIARMCSVPGNPFLFASCSTRLENVLLSFSCSWSTSWILFNLASM